MKKILIAMGLVALVGCQTVTVSESTDAEIRRMRASGVSWAENPPEGYTPAVKMGPAICWAILPGAGQLFMAHKAAQAGVQLGDYDSAALRSKGGLMLIGG